MNNAIKNNDEAYDDPYTAGFAILTDADVEFPSAMTCAQVSRMQQRVAQVLKNRPQMPQKARQMLQAYLNGLKVCNALWLMQNQTVLDQASYVLEKTQPKPLEKKDE